MNVDNPFMESYSKQKQKRRRAEERREIESKGFFVVVVVFLVFLFVGFPMAYGVLRSGIKPVP